MAKPGAGRNPPGLAGWSHKSQNASPGDSKRKAIFKAAMKWASLALFGPNFKLLTLRSGHQSWFKCCQDLYTMHTSAMILGAFCLGQVIAPLWHKIAWIFAQHNTLTLSFKVWVICSASKVYPLLSTAKSKSPLHCLDSWHSLLINCLLSSTSVALPPAPPPAPISPIYSSHSSQVIFVLTMLLVSFILST